MKNLNETIKENLVKESSYAEFSLSSFEPKTNEVAIGVIKDNGNEIGLVIGGCFKGGDTNAQKKAEAELKKHGIKITRTYDEYYKDEMDNDYDLTGTTMCYFVPIEYYNKKTGAEAQVFDGGYYSVQIIQNY